MSFNIVLSCLFAILCTQTQAIFIRSGVLQNHARDLNGGIFDYNANRGISGFITDDGFDKANQRKYIGGQDSGKYSQGLADDKRLIQEDDFSRDNFYKQGASGLSNIDRKAGQKVGHHNTGFTNSYHKDETGSKSNSYDISDDQGDKLLQNSQQGLYGDYALNKNRNANFDGGKYYKDDSRFGVYDNQGLYDKNFGARRNYNQQKYNDDRTLHGQSNIGGRIGESRRYISEEYPDRHHNFGYAHPGYYHLHSRRSYIPVYENTYGDDLYSGYPSHGNFGAGHSHNGFYY